MDERRLTAWLIMQGYLGPDQVKAALEEQLRLKRDGVDVDIIEVARRQKIVTDIQVLEILEKTGYQPPRSSAPPPREREPEPSDAASVSDMSGVSDEGSVDDMSGYSERVPAVSAEKEAKPVGSSVIKKRGMSSASYNAASRRADKTLQNVVIGAFVAVGALVVLMVLGRGNRPSTGNGEVAQASKAPVEKDRFTQLVTQLEAGIKDLTETNIPGAARDADVKRMEGKVAELRKLKLLVSQMRRVDRLALQLDKASGKEGPKPPPEIDLTAEAEVAWRGIATTFEKVLWLSLQQPRSELQRGAELQRGVNLRKQVSEKLAEIKGDGAAIAGLVSAPDLHPILGVGGYRSLLRACERFPQSLRETEKWKQWKGIIARFRQYQKMATDYEDGIRIAEDAAQKGELKKARQAFSTSRYASTNWFAAMLAYLKRPEVVRAFEERAKEVARGGPIVRRRVVPKPAGGSTQTDWGANWKERFLALEGAWKQARRKKAETASIATQLVELLKETESLCKSSFRSCSEIVGFYDAHPKVFKEESATLKAPLQRHHELYFQGAFERATGPGTLMALDRWCASKGYEAWRAQLRPFLRLVATGKSDRGRENKRQGRGLARKAVKEFAEKRLGIVANGFGGLLDWMQKRGFAPEDVKADLDAMISRGIERAGDPVAGSRLRDRLSRLEHSVKGDGKNERKQYAKQLDNVIKVAVNRSLKAVERCVAAGEPGLAFDLFQYVLQLDPENDKAHKGLGHIKVDGKWLRRYYATRLQAGFAWDSKVTWKKVGAEARYAKGEVFDPTNNQWTTLDAANSTHADAGNPWVITTEHFQLRSTANLAETAKVAERLEAFYLQLFRQYDLFFMDKGGAKLIFGMAPTKKQLVVNYYRSQEQFKASANPPTDWAAGFYSGGRHASFFYSSGGWVVLQHEIVHQILGETSPGHAESWLAEGAAVYLEDAFFREGVLTLGEKQHHRRVVTYENMERSGGQEHKLLDMIKFRTGAEWDSGDISKNYRGAGAVVYFLCHFDGGRYRGDFVEYLRAAYNGQRPKLSDFFGMPEQVLDLLMRRFYNPAAKLDLPGGGKATAEDLANALDALGKVAKKKVPDFEQVTAGFDLVRTALSGMTGKELEKGRKKAVSTLASMRKKLSSKVEKAIKAATSGKVLYARLQKLQSLQAEALRVIYDLSIYPDADHGKVGQPTVDEKVKALRDFWNGLPPIFEEEELKAALELLEASEPWLAELGASAKKRGKGKAELEQELRERAGCENLALTPDLKKAKDYNEKVRAYNAAQSQIDADGREQVRVLNDYRIMLGRHALALDDRLYQCAAKHSAYQEQSGNMSHDEPDPARRTPTLRARIEGYMDGVGENVAFGYPTPASAHMGWYNSSGHHRNMCHDKAWTVGVARSGTYWTQVFGWGKATQIQ